MRMKQFTSPDFLTMIRLRVLMFLALMASASANRNWFTVSSFLINKKARKPTSSPRCMPFVDGDGHSCSLASSTTVTSSQTVLNQHDLQEQLMLSLRAGYQEPHWQDVAHQEDVSAMEVEDENDEEEESYSCEPPSIALDEMAMALRWTGELNRRIMSSTSAVAKEMSKSSIMSSSPHSPWLGDDEDSNVFLHAPHQRFRGGEMAMTAKQLKEQEQISKLESLTIFHAKTSFQRDQQRRGALRWGPDLETYLEHLVEQVFELKGETRSLALSLAMMYMDRSTSVETPRRRPHAGMLGTTGGGGRPCPFCTPRTVHRLILTSLYLAVQAILQQQLAMSGGLVAASEQALLPPLVLPSQGQCLFYETKLRSLGIPQEEMHHMIEWMKTALGEPGFFVTSDHMREWRRTWEHSWFTTTTTTKMSTKNQDGFQEATMPAKRQMQPATATAAATAAFVPDHNHYASSLPESPTAQQQKPYEEQPFATFNHHYDDFMSGLSLQRLPIPPSPPQRRMAF